MAASRENALQVSLRLVFVALLIGIAFANYLFYRAESGATIDQAREQLSAIAELRVQQIENWRRERLGDAATFRDNPLFSATLERWLKTPRDDVAAQELVTWLDMFVRHYDFREAAILDPAGHVRFGTRAGLQPDPNSLAAAMETARAIEAPAFSRLYALGDNQQNLDLLVPLFAQHDHRLLGFVLLRVEPQEVLFPMIQSWPLRSASGEFLLVEKRGAEIIYLNELRHVPGTPLLLKRSDADESLPSTHAVRRETTTLEGLDYRGVKVLAATRPVPDTEWSLVAKVDMAEVVAPLHQRVGLMLFSSVLLVLLAGGVTLYVAQGQRMLVARQRQRDQAAAKEIERIRIRLSEAQRIAHIGSWERDIVTNQLWWSDETYRLFQVDPAEMPSPTFEFFQSRLHPEDRDRVRLAILDAIASGTGYTVEYRPLLPDGSSRHYVNVGQVLFDADGRPERIAGTTQDITERTLAEQELQQRHALLKTIIDNIPGGVSLMDGDLNFVAFNEEFARLLDFPPEWTTRTPLPMLEMALYNARRGEYGPGDPEQLAREIVARAKKPVAHIFERTRPNGTVLEVRGAPLPGGGFVTIYTDVTARKKSEESLLLAQKVFDNSPEAIMITDHENRIVSVNEAFTQITGYAPNEVIGADPRILASGVHDAAFYRQMWETLNRTGHWAGEIIDRRKSGDVYPKWMHINAVTEFPAERVTHYVAMFTDITERKRAEERIHFLAHHDALTELPNRLALEARLEQALIEARRHEWHVAVLFIDLDRFKVINDTLGHHVGDRLLIEVARRFQAAVRETDTVARLGGDEFVVILPDLDNPDDAAHVALKVISALLAPIHVDAHELHTSPSIGISLYPDDGLDVETIMKNSDTAMYHAKALGRNNYQFFAAEMNRLAGERLSIEAKLRQAIGRGQLQLHFQPQFSTESMSPTGVEALLRWQLPDEGLVSPDRFITIAEETGLIVGIGDWVLREACRQMKAWISAGLPPIRVAVNLSARQLRNTDLIGTVASALGETRLPPHLLELELTEGAVMDKPEEAIKVLVALKKMGVTLAIDDFGTGYSSLAYLKLFPIDHLKIDRSFVRDIERDPDDAAIAVSTIALAHSLGLKVVAEGVETQAQLAMLREHGCDEVQGFFFSRPLPPDSTMAFLRRAQDERVRRLH